MGNTHSHTATPPHAYRPPAGFPARGETRWQGWLFSLLAHLLLVTAALTPTWCLDDLGHAEGAGGAGPAGGGGGGRLGGPRGDEGMSGERLHYVAVSPPSRSPAPEVVQAPSTPTPPVPKPVVPPVEPRQPAPQPVPPPLPTTAPASASTPGASNAVDGTGAGAGGVSAGSGTGSGPGSGGGTGSGEGSGRGSGVGPGTGGGDGKNHPPTPKQFFLPPLPAPKALAGFTMTAWFEVDSLGNAKLLQFTPSRDRSYNRRLRETLLLMKFRPAVRGDGTPMRDTVDVRFTF